MLQWAKARLLHPQTTIGARVQGKAKVARLSRVWVDTVCPSRFSWLREPHPAWVFFPARRRYPRARVSRNGTWAEPPVETTSTQPSSRCSRQHRLRGHGFTYPGSDIVGIPRLPSAHPFHAPYALKLLPFPSPLPAWSL